jgi:hypothetical protein
VPKLVPPGEGRAPSRRELFARMCYLRGVTDPATVGRLWAEEEAKAPATPNRRARRG